MKTMAEKLDKMSKGVLDQVCAALKKAEVAAAQAQSAAMLASAHAESTAQKQVKATEATPSDEVEAAAPPLSGGSKDEQTEVQANHANVEMEQGRPPATENNNYNSSGSIPHKYMNMPPPAEQNWSYMPYMYHEPMPMHSHMHVMQPMPSQIPMHMPMKTMPFMGAHPKQTGMRMPPGQQAYLASELRMLKAQKAGEQAAEAERQVQRQVQIANKIAQIECMLLGGKWEP